MGKGEDTRAQILDTAFDLSRQLGLKGLSIGMLAERLAMSKSGVFAHFGSKEELQLAVLDEAQARFSERVVRPALSAPRGLARLSVLFENWLNHSVTGPEPGGCLYVQAAAEFDDQPGPVRERVAEAQRLWRDSLAKAIALAVDEGELKPDTDCRQFAFELFGLALAAHHDARLLDEGDALDRARRGLTRLITAYRV